MVAGGSDYALSEVLAAPEAPSLSTGLALLDDLTGGVAPGSLWTISGPAGVGVSSLVLAVAAGVAESGDVIVCNGHLATRTVALRLAHISREASHLRLSSWYRLLVEPPDGFGDTSLERADVVIADTWDETWHAAPWPKTRSELARGLRWLRHLARDSGTALMLTARLQPGQADGPLGWMRDAFRDVADVGIEFSDEPPTTGLTGRRALVRSRGVGVTLVRVDGIEPVRLSRDL